MFETLENIREQLRGGEDSRAEFKEVRMGQRSVVSPNTDDLAGELVAFANAEGGALFLGVRDDGTIQGLEGPQLSLIEGWIINVATNNCDPPIRPVLRKVGLQDESGIERWLLLVEVQGGLFVHRTSGGRFYVRVGSSKRDLTAQELARLFQQRGREYVFDEQPVVTASVEDLDDRALEGFFGKITARPKIDFSPTRVW